jgi:hypothetical protein
MMQNDDTKNFLHGTKDERSERTRALSRRVLDQLALIRSANISDHLSVGEDGKPSLALKDMTPAQWAVVREVRVDSRGRVQVKLRAGQFAIKGRPWITLHEGRSGAEAEAKPDRQ